MVVLVVGVIVVWCSCDGVLGVDIEVGVVVFSVKSVLLFGVIIVLV